MISKTKVESGERYRLLRASSLRMQNVCVNLEYKTNKWTYKIHSNLIAWIIIDKDIEEEQEILELENLGHVDCMKYLMYNGCVKKKIFLIMTIYVFVHCNSWGWHFSVSYLLFYMTISNSFTHSCSMFTFKNSENGIIFQYDRWIEYSIIISTYLINWYF